jgi:hypothetical protein
MDACGVHFRNQPPDGAHVYHDDDSVDIHCQIQREKSSSEIDYLSGMVMLLDCHHHCRQALLQREQQNLNHIHQIKLQRELIILRFASGTRNGFHHQVPAWEEYKDSGKLRRLKFELPLNICGRRSWAGSVSKIDRIQS